MTPKEIWEYFGSGYRFNKATKISASSLTNWMRWGYVPEGSQYKIEKITGGKLKAEEKWKII